MKLLVTVYGACGILPKGILSLITEMVGRSSNVLDLEFRGIGNGRRSFGSADSDDDCLVRVLLGWRLSAPAK